MSTDIFCTPEQGKRLKDLLPKLTSEYYWIFDVDCIIGSYPFDKDHLSNGAQKIPALTLQELRDVAKINNKMFNELLAYRLHFDTAPELAEWVIARLEKQQ
jgi:hypothetical protein